MNKKITFFRLDDYSERGFSRLFKALDLLHAYASEGHLTDATTLRPSEVVGWLEDILFTVEETIREIDAHEANRNRFVEQILARWENGADILD